MAAAQGRELSRERKGYAWLALRSRRPCGDEVAFNGAEWRRGDMHFHLWWRDMEFEMPQGNTHAQK